MIPDPDGAAAAARWWRSLQPDPERGRSGDRAALARLRRCATIAEAIAEPTAIELFRQTGADHPTDLVAVSLAAAVLSQVRVDDPGQRVARRIGPAGRPNEPETALVKPLRFGRLMTAATPDERLVAMRRVVALANATLSVRDLADALLFWTDRRRQRWIYEYWNAGASSVPIAGAVPPVSPASAALVEDPIA